MAIGDTHKPFQHQPTLDEIYRAAEREQPNAIVQMGDLYDFYSASKFPRSHNIMTPKQEAEEGFAAAENMWKNLRKIVPKAECYQLWGNHDVRPQKRIMELVPHLAHFFKIEDMFKFPGVSTILSERDDLEIDGVVYEHGYFGKPGQHMKENMRRTVIGHTHRPWLHYEQIRGQLLWELNVGYVGNPEAAALQYQRKKWEKWVRGYGLITADQIPLFFHVMEQIKRSKAKR